ncbi:PaaI family thioesterase [Methylomarinum sp. Ch1-1]|uniref:PaaI family thioesterase n=1 Tax=Methylomarinum roseum TaxID=3067653 RepID=A0AAU7NXD3_9GAMM|nr:PaaI family thioesterase [Methylomarinum sp. Ch1-1]MDP4522189.1 PaaI family thioesterase [Methylomarinum sp. Ch1-1]
MNLRKLIWNARWLSDEQRIKWYPAFWLMRLKVLELSPCWRRVTILLPHSWIATNTGGSMFGGFQACLADPIAAMSCLKVFPGYSVWTRSLHLDFRREGLSDLQLRFAMSSEQEQQIRRELERKGRSTPEFEYGYYQADGSLCTLIRARVAIRPKGYKKDMASNVQPSQP